MSAPPEGPLPTIAGYEILEIIGEGGMGTVYLAHDVKHDRRVAIKTIRRDYTNPDVVERFEREIRLTSSLQHPRILPLLDSGFADGTLYYVMQYIDGESLEARLQREGALPMDDALRIARHVTDALDYAHERGVVHRDIKPANIMLSGRHALVMDFGIGRALSGGSTSLTGTGSALGTPKYMSPEQIADASAVDGRTDTYSLGCVLYEMIGGHPPFTGPTLDSILRQHLTADPPSLAVHRPGTPPEIEEIVKRAMEKSPADRFPRARDLADEIQRITTHGIAVPVPRSAVRTGFLVIAGYLAGAWGVLAIVERVADTANLPSWTVPFALLLLLIGLLVVAATTVIQTVGLRRLGLGTTDPGTTGSGRRRRAARRRRIGALFRWRNVAAGGVLALALWGLVASVALYRQGRAGRSDTGGTDFASGASGGAEPTGVSSPIAGDPGNLAGQDPAGEGGEATRDAGDGTPVETPALAAGNGAARPEGRANPPPPPPPMGDAGGGAGDDVARVLASARAAAERARGDAEAAGARIAPTPALARADSLWTEAGRAESGNRPAEAVATLGLARTAYEAAGQASHDLLDARIDSALRSVDSLRSRADASNAPYADAERFRRRGLDARGRGDLPTALDELAEAGRFYSRALPTVELPPPYEPDAAEPGTAPAATPEERIDAAMSALERAFEAEDLAAISRIWTSLGQDETRSFRDFFDNGSDFDYAYEIDPHSIRQVGAGIEFAVHVHWSYRESRGDRIVTAPVFDQRFRLEEVNGRDVLTDLP